jgi:hypothetical protein
LFQYQQEHLHQNLLHLAVQEVVAEVLKELELVVLI